MNEMSYSIYQSKDKRVITIGLQDDFGSEQNRVVILGGQTVTQTQAHIEKICEEVKKFLKQFDKKKPEIKY